MNRALPLAFLAMVAVSSPALAAWPHDAAANLPICTNVAMQATVRAIPDGFGNTILVWRDGRQGGTIIHAQRVRPNGTVCWAADGVPLCNQVTYAEAPVLVADGAGGAIVAWEDGRPQNSYDVYAQRIDSTGALAWNAGGVPLCTADWTQHNLAITSDGAGGAIVAWNDQRYGMTQDIYAQRVSNAGLTRWAANGLLVCNVPTFKYPPAIVADGAGGACVMWSDCRGEVAVYEAYVQRISAAGAVQWTSGGVRAFPALASQTGAALVPDATGGCIVVAYGPRGGGGNYDAAAQRLAPATGAPRWTTSGATLVAAAGTREGIRAVSDGRGGVIAAWYETRNGNGDVYAARADSNGVASWAAGGVPVCVAAGEQTAAELVPDGAGGAVIAWEDYRGGAEADVYAQRVGAAGAVSWLTGGVAVSSAVSDQTRPVLASSSSGGATLAWADARAGNSDVYAQWIDGGGLAGGPVTGVLPREGVLAVTLAPLLPNPAHGSATARYALPRSMRVRLALVDPAGRIVRSLADGWRGAGEHAEPLDLRDDHGRTLPAGLYFVRLEAAGMIVTRRIVSLK